MILPPLLAVDPSKHMLHCAVGLKGGDVWFFSIPTIPRTVAITLRVVVAMGVQSIRYEDCYAAANLETYGDLVALKRRVEECAFEQRLPMEVVVASSWQSPMLRCARDSGRLKRAELKRRSVLLAEDQLGYRIPSSDSADAFCILFSQSSHMDRITDAYKGRLYLV